MSCLFVHTTDNVLFTSRKRPFYVVRDDVVLALVRTRLHYPIRDNGWKRLVLTVRIFLPVIRRSAILQLPDLFVSAVIPDEEEAKPEQRNEADDLDVYRCPVFMNRVSFRFIPTSSSLLGRTLF